MVKLRIKNLTKIYNKKTVLNNITFSVEDGEFLSILGSSGCGKTTLLRIIIGIETPSSGKITYELKYKMLHYCGYYWLNAHATVGTGSAAYAWVVDFSSEGISAGGMKNDDYVARNTRCAVRLVQDVE